MVYESEEKGKKDKKTGRKEKKALLVGKLLRRDCNALHQKTSSSREIPSMAPALPNHWSISNQSPQKY